MIQKATEAAGIVASSLRECLSLAAPWSSSSCTP